VAESIGMNVAIVIPAYNAGPYLAEAIESALAQTRPAAAVVVVDDGSTDETAKIARQFEPRIAVVTQPNAGVSVARNTGAARAKAEWFLFLDADDRLVLDALERFEARGQQRPDCRVIYGQGDCFNDATTESFLRGTSNCEGAVPAATRANFWKSAIVTPGAAVIRAEVFQQVGGFAPEWNNAADRDFWIKAGMYTPFAFVEGPVMQKRLHGENMSADKNRARRQGAEVQLAFLEWCRTRDLQVPDGIDAERIISQNLRLAIEQHSYLAAQWLCEEAARRQLASRQVADARSLLRLPKWGREVRLFFRRHLARAATLGQPDAGRPPFNEAPTAMPD
jgi:glycosyltransferase involved in cell wall biosynthesis